MLLFTALDFTSITSHIYHIDLAPKLLPQFFLILDAQNMHITEGTNHLIFKQEKPYSLRDAELVES